MKTLIGLCDLAKLLWWLGRKPVEAKLQRYKRWLSEWESLAGI